MQRCLATLSALLGLSSLLAAQAGPGGPGYVEWRERVSLASAAKRPPLQFVGWLVEAGVPAGIEAREPGLYQDGAALPRLEDVNAIATDAAILAFNAEHPDFRASARGGVVVIRPANQVRDYLDGPAPLVHILGKGLMSAGEQLFAPLNPLLIAPGGRAGSVLGGGGIDRGEDALLDIDVSGLTVLDALNAIERQVPGHAWLVIERDTPPAVLRFGFVNRFQQTMEEIVTR